MRVRRIFLVAIGATAMFGCSASGSSDLASDYGPPGSGGDGGASLGSTSSGGAPSGGSTAGGSSGSGASAGGGSSGGGGSTSGGSSGSGGGSSSGGSAGPDASAGGHADGGHLGGADGATPPGPDGSVVVTGGFPNIGGCDIFPPDDAWNTRIDDPVAYPLHPNAATYAANMDPTRALHPDWGDWTTNQYGIPWQIVASTQAPVPISFTAGSAESDPGPYPIPPNAKVEGGAGGAGGDQHVLVLQAGTCMLYELYQGAFTSPGWSCTSAAKFDLGSNALRPDGWTSTDAAGLPILPGLVKLAEVKAGAIKHALRFTVAKTQQAYIHPATHAAGAADTSLPPMGLRVRLKASFDTSGLSGPALVIATAMKQYGLILADNGSSWYVTGDSDDGWTPLMGGISTALGSIHGSDFEAVMTGAISSAGL